MIQSSGTSARHDHDRIFVLKLTFPLVVPAAWELQLTDHAEDIREGSDALGRLYKIKYIVRCGREIGPEDVASGDANAQPINPVEPW